MSSTDTSPSRSLVYIHAIFRSSSSTWLAVIVPVQYDSGVNQGSTSRSPPGFEVAAHAEDRAAHALLGAHVGDRAEQARDDVEPAPEREVRHVGDVKRHAGAAFARDLEQVGVEVEPLDLVAVAQELEMAPGATADVEQGAARGAPSSSGRR